ncbi:MAG: cell division protein FtsZ [Paludibacteraceae bacterium]|nr:cell division protein FtsZ [Paludibacteraceae bacterium]
MDEIIPIEPDFREQSLIKVLGVGGGGNNAVNFLYRENVKDVSFLVCNTDSQALMKSPVPAKLQLGPGWGAGGKPEKARELAEASRDDIRKALDDGTQMVFITAGMGGGTGTGASPVVAEVAQEMGILTVAIVTIPFAFEGKKTIRKALQGVAVLAEHVDAILVINNEKLPKIYPDFDLPNAFQKSDEVVSNAAKAIAEIITIPGYINTDFQDVYNTLKNGGMAIMNVGRSANPEQRITEAINQALNSPLVNTTDVHGASRILLNFYCSTENAIRMQELDQINRFIDQVGDDVEVKWGASYDESLGDEVRVTVIATGYSVSNIPGIEAQKDEPKHVTPDIQVKITIDDAIKGFYDEKTEEPSETAGQQEETQDEQQVTEEATTDAEPEIIDNDEVVSAQEQIIEEQQQEQPMTADNTAASTYFDFDLDDDTEQQLDSVPAWMRQR